ncbi:hypothetical protein MNBD_GAMMA16-1300, partial [hydrothermal vent metagenome]
MRAHFNTTLEYILSHNLISLNLISDADAKFEKKIKAKHSKLYKKISDEV